MHAFVGKFSLKVVLLCLAGAAFAPRLMADPIHLVQLTDKTNEENQYQTVVKLALGNQPAANEKWADDKVITLYLASRKSDKPEKNTFVTGFISNKDASVAVVNYRPARKQHGTCLLVSTPEQKTVTLLTDFNERVAALCQNENKTVNDMDMWVERIEGDLLTLHSQTTKGDRNTLTVRVTPRTLRTGAASENKDALRVAVPPETTPTPVVTLQLVRYSRSKVSADPPQPFPVLPSL